MIPLYAPETVRELDRRAMARGVAPITLMERAAAQLAHAVVRTGGHTYGLRVAVLCGKGNNGGDGVAAARRLRQAGAAPVVWLAEPQGSASAETAVQLTRWRAIGGVVEPDLERALRHADVVVDCLLGTGASGPPRGGAASAIERLSGVSAPVVACDLPSGVDARTGAVPGLAVRARLTLSIGVHKLGLHLWPARGHCGALELADIGIADAAEPPAAVVLDDADAARLLPPPPPDAEKRGNGTVLVLAGSPGMIGAAVLAARGAVVGGAGLVTVAAAPEVLAVVAAAAPEVLGLPLAGDAAASRAAVLQAAGRADAVVVGPGLGRDPAAISLVRELVAGASVPLVLDADGLNAFAGSADELARHAGPSLVLTPHRRELARLTGLQDLAVWPARVDLVPELARRWRATVVAKGPGTLVVAPDGQRWVNASGSPALAVGGTGDVLAGMLGAALAGGRGVGRVAATVHVHGRAGELAASGGSARSAGPVELLAAVPAAFRRLEDSA